MLNTVIALLCKIYLMLCRYAQATLMKKSHSKALSGITLSSLKFSVMLHSPHLQTPKTFVHVSEW